MYKRLSEKGRWRGEVPVKRGVEPFSCTPQSSKRVQRPNDFIGERVSPRTKINSIKHSYTVEYREHTFGRLRAPGEIVTVVQVSSDTPRECPECHP